MQSKGGNASRMKQENRLLVLRMLRSGAMSRAEVSRRTGLTRAAVSLIIDPLLEQGMVTELGPGEAVHGRKPVLLAINQTARAALAINITRRCCWVGVMDLGGNCHAKRKLPLLQTPQATLEAARQALDELLERQGLSPTDVVGLGITAPGPLDRANGVILRPPNFDGWRDIAVLPYVSYPFPVFLENNASALALAERQSGSVAGYQNYMLLTVDSGVGAGIVQNGQLLRDLSGFGSELGHTTIQFDGKPCGCGNRGCLEAYASMPELLKQARQMGVEADCWREIADGAAAGQLECSRLLEQEAAYLAAGIVSAVNLFALQAVVLSGDIAYRPQQLTSRIAQLICGRTLSAEPDILVSEILDETGLTAASMLAVDAFFQSGDEKL